MTEDCTSASYDMEVLHARRAICPRKQRSPQAKATKASRAPVHLCLRRLSLHYRRSNPGENGHPAPAAGMSCTLLAAGSGRNYLDLALSCPNYLARCQVTVSVPPAEAGATVYTNWSPVRTR